MPLALIAVGGNSLAPASTRQGNIHDQFANARETARNLVEVVREGWDLVMTHGNGPQVGNLLLRMEIASHQVFELPLGVCDADTQGGIGYMLQQVLGNQLRLQGLERTVVSIVTQVEVHPDDPELNNPSKPIGSFYDEATARQKIRVDGWQMREDSGRGWRRLVPSPHPVRIVELDAIRRCLGDGMIPIAVGGGGIPVVRKGNILDGVDGVIDKDRASALLARDLGVQVMAISTTVPSVQIGFGTPSARVLSKVTAAELRAHQQAGEFPAGSMGPKIEAALSFLEAGGQRVVITDPPNLRDALQGNAGTQITPE